MEYILNFTIIYGVIPFILFYSLKIKIEVSNCIYPFLLVVFISSIYELIGFRFFDNSYENWYLIYKTLAFIGIHYYFYHLLNKDFKLIFISFILIYILLLVFAFTVWKNFIVLDINAYFNMYQTIIVLTFSVLWLRRLFLDLSEENLAENPNFYFISGLLIYYCGTFFLFLMSSSLYTQDKSSFQYYWLLNILLNFVLRSLLIFGVWKARVK
jgi:hypothetical protein